MVEADDIGVDQARKGFGFSLHAFTEGIEHGRSELVDPDDLDDHILPEEGIEGFVEGYQVVFAELLEDVVATDGLAGQIKHSLSLL